MCVHSVQPFSSHENPTSCTSLPWCTMKRVSRKLRCAQATSSRAANEAAAAAAQPTLDLLVHRGTAGRGGADLVPSAWGPDLGGHACLEVQQKAVQHMFQRWKHISCLFRLCEKINFCAYAS